MRRFATAVLFVVLGVEASSASTVLRFGPDELSTRARVILHGQISSKRARRLPKGVIVTDYEVKVYEAIKGTQVKLFRFTAYGGVLGERASAISGAPKFKLKEEVLLFLSPLNKLGCRTTIGLAQGKYSIRTVKKKKLAFRDLEGLRLLDPKTRKINKAQPEQGVDFLSLLARVKRRIKTKTRPGRKG